MKSASAPRLLYATEPLEILPERGQEVVIEDLRQRHDPGHHEAREWPGDGQWDNMYARDVYALNWNWRLGYIGLEYRVVRKYPMHIS